MITGSIMLTSDTIPHLKPDIPDSTKYSRDTTFAVSHLIRAVRYHLKFVYHDTVARVSQYALGIDTSHDMAYRLMCYSVYKIWP